MAEYLEREGLLRELRLWHMHKTDSLPDHFHYTGIKAWLEALPAEDVQPVKHGQWVLDNPEQVLMHCSNCNWRNLSWKWKYCPNCGARMDGEE